MRNIVLMAALGAAFLVTGCGPGDTMMMPPPDCSLPGELAEGCSELRLSSTPGGAAVTIDGIAAGSTPVDTTDFLRWRGPSGLVTVEAALAGYEPFLVDLPLPNGDVLDYGAVLVPEMSVMGTVMVSADVLGGTVVIDGVDHGIMDTMPMGIDVPAGTHRVTVRDVPGHVAGWDEVMVVGGETASVMLSVGRDISGVWNFEMSPRMRTVVMDATSARNTVFAVGLDSFVYIRVNGDSLSSMEGGTITGTIAADGRSLEFTFTGASGSYTERATR